jgi:hypothetical protein
MSKTGHTLEQYYIISNLPEWTTFWDKWYAGFGTDKGSWGVGPRATLLRSDDPNRLKIRDLDLFYQYRTMCK